MGLIDEAVARSAPLLHRTAQSARGGDGPNRIPVGTSVAIRDIRYTHTRCVDVARALLRRNRVISGFDRCFYTDVYRILATQVSQRLRTNGWSTLAVTSPGRSEGKTLTAINLAVSLAAEFNQTALLVDADLWRPSVSTYFGLEGEAGLSDYLLSNKPLGDLLIHPGIPGFVFLPGGAPSAKSSEALGSYSMGELVQELKTRYLGRIVVFDLPPLLDTADVLAFAPYIDAALLVVEEGKTLRGDVKRACELLTNTHLLGTILNKSTEVKVPRESRRRFAKWFSRDA
ncbi:MAG TPA: CpsD/CapB family tyrosine-protein kinase [Burkholderiales bacterium]|nr:CpsD/CapB family tyrosine-protein kinase [Burkholderiales bacterium]